MFGAHASVMQWRNSAYVVGDMIDVFSYDSYEPLSRHRLIFIIHTVAFALVWCYVINLPVLVGAPILPISCV